MNMKFYMTPGSCSTGIHILLEELEEIFEVYIVNLLAGDQFKDSYVSINPKSTIPTLVKPDGTALTDFVAICYWLAQRHPKKHLLPGNADGNAAVLETMNYIVATIHMQGFARIFVTQDFSRNGRDYDHIQARGTEIIEKGFSFLNTQLDGKEYIACNYSIADLALFYVEFWADKIKLALPPNCLAHYKRMLNRPAVKRVLAEEGYRT